MDDDATLIEQFVTEYGTTPRIFSAPGRVNLIGDHTDYNDGFALPIAIGQRTVVAAAKREDRKIRVRSLLVAETAQVDLTRPEFARRRTWVDYIEGVARSLESRGVKTSGADLLVKSDVPLGAGLSSSAALEMSVGLALLALAGDQRLSPRDLAQAAQSAEHTYVGAEVGIMDQLVAALGRRDHALLIDSRSLGTTDVPCTLRGATILLCDTKVKHELASSAYNERRRECETSVSILRTKLPHLRALRDLSVTELEAHGELLSETLRRRCRHVVTENARTLDAVRALSRDDLVEFGRLMFASHASLRSDYEVSCAELDLAVEVATGARGVYGARMTGGGFGGCTVNLVADEAADELAKTLDRTFEQRFRTRPHIFSVRASDGMREH
ncbi:MAG TPA: galactokinase [Polyangiaceae bacterium]|nr:galactokinase [Polyangiaceae bacterium]